MMTKFWDKLSEGLAESWNSRLLLPGAAFLAFGLLTLIVRFGYAPLAQALTTIPAPIGFLLAAAGLFFIVLSGWVVQRLSLPMLRLFEGYWGWVFARLSRYWGQRFARQIAALRQRRQALAQRYDQLTPAEQAEYARLDAELPTYPVQAELFLPTRLGNLLRAAEEYPRLRYGLEMYIVWPRLWLLLPETTRDELSAAREALDASARRMVWSILCAAWVMFVWWAPLAAIAMAVFSYWSMLADAGVYGELLRAAYDLHRGELYKALRWELPLDPEKEIAQGQALTEYLQRGNAPPGFKLRK